MKISRWAAYAARLIFMISATFNASAVPSAPVKLLVNGMNDPLAIDRGATRFTWMSHRCTRGERQTAYEIMVERRGKSGEGEEQRAGVGGQRSEVKGQRSVVWDSGKVDSDNRPRLNTEGLPCPPRRGFGGKCGFGIKPARPSPYSAPAFFDTGLNQDDWTATIHLGWNNESQQFRLFPKDICDHKSAGVGQSLCDGAQRLSPILQWTTFGPGPARCDPYHYGQYNAYDITKLVKPGTNVFAAMAHWQGNWNDSGHQCQASLSAGSAA